MVKMEQGVDRVKAATFAWNRPLPDAYGHADYGGGVHAGRLRQFLDRRIHRFDVLGAGDRAHRFVVRRGDFHTLSRGENYCPISANYIRITTPMKSIARPYTQTTAGDRLERRPSRRVVATTVGVFVLAALGFTHVQKQFFPLSERPELFFQLRLPEGSAIALRWRRRNRPRLR